MQLVCSLLKLPKLFKVLSKRIGNSRSNCIWLLDPVGLLICGVASRNIAHFSVSSRNSVVKFEQGCKVSLPIIDNDIIIINTIVTEAKAIFKRMTVAKHCKPSFLIRDPVLFMDERPLKALYYC